MKKGIKKITFFLKQIFLWILKFFRNILNPQTKKETKKQRIEKNELKQKQNNEKSIIAENPSNTDRNLQKEYFHNKEIFLPSKEDLEKMFSTFIEKTFKLKIDKLPKETQKDFLEYQTKAIKKIIPKIAKQEITTIETLEKVLKENLKEDLQKKNLNIEVVIQQPSLYTEQKKNIVEEKIEQTTTNDLQPIELPEIKKTSSLTEQISPFFINLDEKIAPTNIENNTPLPPKENKIKETIQKKETETTSLEEIKSPLLEQENNLQELLLEQKTNLQDLPKETINIEQKQNLEQPLPKNIKSPEKKEVIEKKKAEQKIEKKQEIVLNLAALELETQKVIEEVKQEYTKEELIDKNYEKAEKLLEEKINDIEKMLQKPLSEMQKKKLKRELEKLKETKQQLYLYKEKDLEELRKSLEENIPLEELMLVTDKLKKLTEDEEIKRKEMLYQDIEKKTQKEIQEMEKVLIKESFKKTLRRLETPLFLSFPFIKNKHFRRFVSGLFLFRSIGFIKNLLFGFPDTYEPIDLSYIQRGSDALIESISLTEKNLQTFNNLKQTTLIKYPDLIEDELFIKDLNKLEEQLRKNYEKLLQQEALVGKYFDKSKVLIRKRKKVA